MTTNVQINDLITRLHTIYPDAHCELHYETPIQLLIATILSAQCTDERVNQVTASLFQTYKTAVDFAAANREELEQAVRPAGFFRRKAKHIQEASHIIVHQHGGEMPNTMEELLALPGVARKTANVVLGEIFQIADGVTVDTHVKRLSKKLGLTKADDPKKVEQDLMRIIPHSEWINISHLLIFHGRQICHARRPKCSICPLNDTCPSAEIDAG
ncbi:MAG: endonuclease III [Chloroflexota bacterium]